MTADEAGRPVAVVWAEGPVRLELHSRNPTDGHSLLVLNGPLTAGTAHLAREALRAATHAGPWLLVDVDGVTRLDRHGLALLIATLHHLRWLAADGCLHLRAADASPTAWALARSGVWKILPLQSGPFTCSRAVGLSAPSVAQPQQPGPRGGPRFRRR